MLANKMAKRAFSRHTPSFNFLNRNRIKLVESDESFDYRAYLEYNNYKLLSPWHDLPLKADDAETD